MLLRRTGDLGTFGEAERFPSVRERAPRSISPVDNWRAVRRDDLRPEPRTPMSVVYCEYVINSEFFSKSPPT